MMMPADDESICVEFTRQAGDLLYFYKKFTTLSEKFNGL
jgi:hypothetical protein